MRQITTTAFLGILALTITGCPSSDTPQSTNPTSLPSTPPVAVSPSPVVKPPLIAQNPTNPAYLAPGLIQPTNANQRTKQVAKGNRDPFAALFVPIPAPLISSGNTPNNSASAPSQAPQGSSAPTVSSRQTTRTTKTQTSSRTVNNRQSSPNSVAINNPRTVSNRSSSSTQTETSTQNPSSSPNTTLPNNILQPSMPPAMPEPELAQNVTVMGVIQIGEQTQAIVQVPNEATSRYVRVGQSLSNGQVLVKRIELNTGAEPLVILEQNGVEVSKAVGEMAPSKAETTPTAAVPYSPPQNSNAPTATIPPPPPSSTAPSLNTNAPTAAVPYLPPQNPNAPTAVLPEPPQNINISGVNISGARSLPNAPTTSNR